MRQAAVSEASRFPYVTLRNQPYRIYKRFEGHRSEYDAKCGAAYRRIGHRYFRIRYRSTDGLFVEGVVAVPEGFDPARRYPAVIFNRGNWEEGRRFTFCFTGSYEMWTRRGFIVFGPQYRGANGSEGVDQWGGDDVNDVVSIVAIAKAYPFVEEKNVFMHGNSRGGMMTYLALERGVRVNAAIVNCGVASLRHPPLEDDVLARILPETMSAQQRALEYKKRSAVEWAEKLDVPLLIIHGARDEGVPLEGVRRLESRLRALGKVHKVLVYPEAGHCGEGYPDTFVDDVFSWVQRFRDPAVAP